MGRGHLEDLGIDGRIILKFFLKEQGAKKRMKDYCNRNQWIKYAYYK
jgi:hypothetical protein